MVAGPGVEVRLLGRFVVLVDGLEIPTASFGGRKVRCLLRILATRRGQFVAHDQLTEMLWPERPPADPAANLQVLVNRIRRATGQPALVLTGPGGYALSADPRYVVDTETFLQAVSSASAAEGKPALIAYQETLAAWVGEPLSEDRYAEWAQPYRNQLARVHQEVLERAADLAVQVGEFNVAIDHASLAAAQEPLREAATLTLVRALAAAGDQAAALEQYERYRRTLAEDLGLDPSAVAAAVHDQLLNDPRAAGPAATRLAALPRGSKGFGALPFVGRAAERATVLAALHADEGTVVAIAGRSGTGKTRLLRQVSDGVDVLSVRAFWPERSEPWSLAGDLMREALARDTTVAGALPPALRAALEEIVPEALEGNAAPFGADAESRRAFIFEASARLIRLLGVRAVVIDDLQWADPSSLLLLAAVLDRVPGLSMVLAYRPEELDPSGDAAAFLRRVPISETLELSGLDGAAIGELCTDPATADTLEQATDATPLAVAEVLRVLAHEGLVDRDSTGRFRSRSPRAASRARQLGAFGQRRAIARRAESQGGDGPLVLGALALLARESPARTLAAAAGLSETATLDALASLSAAGLVRLGEGGWTTAHDMVGEVVVDRLSEVERCRLHGQLARTLDSEQGNPSERARHWQGAGDLPRAAEAFAAAAAAALGSYAHAEAIALADAGLACLDERNPSAELLEVRAQARRRGGDIAGARTDLRAALAIHRAGDARAVVLAQLASLASGADDLVRASALVELAIVEAGDGSAARAQALEVASVLDMNLDRAARAEQRAAEALAMYQRAGDSAGAARVLDARAMATFIGGDVRSGTRLLRQAADLFEDSGDLMRVVTPRSTCGHGQVFMGLPHDGLREASSALDIARSLGHPEAQAYALWHCSEALSAIGDGPAALEAGEEALAIATRIVHRGWTATAWRAIGIAEQVLRDPERALASFTTSLDLSENLNLFGCWAMARAALVSVTLGRLDDAARLAERALATGPGIGQYEARLARVEVASARGEPKARASAVDAQRRAEAGGALAHLERLTTIIEALPKPVD